MRDPVERFLAEVERELPLPDDRRQEVLEELQGHVADSVARLRSEGTDAVSARAEAVRRMGEPAALARDLAAAQRGGRRVLAAAGAGTWAAIRTALPVTILAWTSIALLALIAGGLVRIARHLLGQEVSLLGSGSLNDVFGALGLNLGAGFAGAAAVRAAARSGWRSPAEVRSAVTIAGTAAVMFFAVAMLETTLTWAVVAALLLVPLSFAVGTRFDRLAPPSISAMLLGTLLLFVAGVGLTAYAGGSSGSSSYSWDQRQAGWQMVAPWWQDPASGQAVDFASGESFSFGPGQIDLTIIADPAVTAGLSGYRVEAWRAVPPQDGWHLVPGQTAPFANAPAAAEQDGVVSGRLRFDRMPAVQWAAIALTAAGPDGQRYLLYASGPTQTEFHGTVLDWFTGLAR